MSIWVKKVPENSAREPGLHRIRPWQALVLVLLAATGLATRALAEAPLPEAATGRTTVQRQSGSEFMVVTANALASEAAAAAIRAGGSAVDAAIAAQMVLTLVEPQSSGIGGGAFMLHYDGRTLRAFDGRETAPRAATPNLFLKADGSPMAFDQAVVGGRSVGAPGVLRLLEMTHRRFGRLPWADLFRPAILLAEEGFPVSPRLHDLLLGERLKMVDPAARAYFYRPDGSPWPVGHLLKNPQLAGVLRHIAESGVDAFYTGPLARDIVAKVRGHATNPGLLDENDLSEYWAETREPVCVRHLGDRVCGFPPPSAGGIAVGQIVGIVGRKGIANVPPQPSAKGPLPSAAAIHLFAEAGRLAFADRDAYVADPAFFKTPAGLLDDSYLDTRARLIGERSLGVAKPGRLPGAPLAGGDATQERPATSHISIVDRQGQAVAMTTTIEGGFGARLMVHGFLLNNQLTDFSFVPSVDGRPAINRVEPGKRPRSSMAPTMVFAADGKLKAVLGSAGGPSIINHVARTLVGLLDWKLDVGEAVAMPNFGSRNGPTEIEAGFADRPLVEELQRRGHQVVETTVPSGLAAIVRTPGGWVGAADPRREGVPVAR